MVIFGDKDKMVEHFVKIDARIFLKARHGNRVTATEKNPGNRRCSRNLDKQSAYEGSKPNTATMSTPTTITKIEGLAHADHRLEVSCIQAENKPSKPEAMTGARMKRVRRP